MIRTPTAGTRFKVAQSWRARTNESRSLVSITVLREDVGIEVLGVLVVMIACEILIGLVVTI